MNSFTMLTEERAAALSREQLVAMYNDAVEMIWFLEIRVKQLSEENDSVWKSYEELSNRYFG